MKYSIFLSFSIICMRCKRPATICLVQNDICLMPCSNSPTMGSPTAQFQGYLSSAGDLSACRTEYICGGMTSQILQRHQIQLQWPLRLRELTSRLVTLSAKVFVAPCTRTHEIERLPVRESRHYRFGLLYYGCAVYHLDSTHGDVEQTCVNASFLGALLSRLIDVACMHARGPPVRAGSP